jgi:hypothetical protein
MKRALLLSLVAASIWAQSTRSIRQTPILTAEQVKQLEADVAKDSADGASQALLGKNYAFFILGIAGLNQYGNVDAVDPAKAESEFAQYARQQLAASRLPVICGQGRPSALAACFRS